MPRPPGRRQQHLQGCQTVSRQQHNLTCLVRHHLQRCLRAGQTPPCLSLTGVVRQEVEVMMGEFVGPQCRLINAIPTAAGEKCQRLGISSQESQAVSSVRCQPLRPTSSLTLILVHCILQPMLPMCLSGDPDCLLWTPGGKNMQHSNRQAKKIGRMNHYGGLS